MKLKLLCVLFFIAVSYKATAQITYIPDQGFEWQLIHLNIDSDGIINGQVLTSDVENVTELIMESWNSPYITDLTGIQDFTSLEKLVVTFVYLTELDVSQNLQLRYLDCSSNELTSLDVSSNILLEELHCGNYGIDVAPFNMIEEIDLSNNPEIKIVDCTDMGIKRIKLSNGNNNSEMTIDVALFPWGLDEPDYDPYEIRNTVCLEVDDVALAQNNQYPYSEWNIFKGGHVAVNFSADCSLSTQSFTQSNIKVYPNPVSDVLYFDTKSNNYVQKVTIFDFLGRKVTDQTNITDAISVSHLQKGSYLIKIVTDKGVQTEKIIVE